MCVPQLESLRERAATGSGHSGTLCPHTHTPQHTLTSHHLVHSCPHATTAVVQELQERLQSAMAQKLAARAEMEVQAAAFRQRLRYTRVLAEVTNIGVVLYPHSTLTHSHPPQLRHYAQTDDPTNPAVTSALRKNGVTPVRAAATTVSAPSTSLALHTPAPPPPSQWTRRHDASSRC